MSDNDPLGREGGDFSCAGGAGDAAPLGSREAVRHDYVHGDLSLNRIGAKHGITGTTVCAWAKAEGWVRLVGTRGLKPGKKPRPPGVPPSKRSAADEMRRRKLMRRLFAMLDAKLTELEMRMQGAEGEIMPQSAADAERDARNLNALARLYAKLVELDDQANQKASDRPEDSRSDDADQFRRDLALRLERLDQAGEA